MGAVLDALEVEKLVKFGGVNYTPSHTTLTNGGTLALTSDSNCLQFLQGSGTGFSVRLPDARTLIPGRHFIVANHTGFVVGMRDGAGNFLFTLSQESIAYVYLQMDTTAAGYWMYYQILASSTASGIINYNITADTIFTTNSVTDEVITAFTLTPQAGKYAVWFNTDAIIVQNNAKAHCSLYKNSTQIGDSERSTQGVSSNFECQLASMSIIDCNGTDVISVRVRISTSSLSVLGRSMLLIRLGN